jgi:hypothetical protein
MTCLALQCTANAFDDLMQRDSFAILDFLDRKPLGATLLLYTTPLESPDSLLGDKVNTIASRMERGSRCSCILSLPCAGRWCLLRRALSLSVQAVQRQRCDRCII